MTTNNQLSDFVARIEHLQSDKKALADNIREVFTEAKDAGFDPKIIRLVLKRRELTTREIEEREALIATYEAALGDLAGTPLADASRP